MCAKIVSDDLFDDIISSAPMSFFKHTLDVGKVDIIFTSSIAKVDPGDEDLLGRIWDPKTVDANGMPLMDQFTGRPKEAWTKFEATCLVDGSPSMYSFSGEKSSVLREFSKAMKKYSISNKELKGTKWTINRIGKWDWDIKYIEKVDIDGEGKVTSPSSPSQAPTKANGNSKDIKSILTQYKQNFPDKIAKGVNRNALIQYICFELDYVPSEVDGILTKLVDEKFLIWKNDGTVSIA